MLIFVVFFYKIDLYEPNVFYYILFEKYSDTNKPDRKGDATMEGITYRPMRIDMEKPYLSVSGIDYMGHAVFQKAAEPLELHTHKDCMEIVFVFGGEQTYYTENDYYPLVGGQAFISFMNEPHRSDENCQGVGEIYWFQLNLSCWENFLGFNRELSIDIISRLLEIDRHVFRFDSRIKGLVKRTFDEFYEKGTTTMALTSLMYLILQVLDCVRYDRLPKNRFSDLEKYIDAHIGQGIRIEDLSHASGFSVSTLQHKFKEYFGRTPAEYINYKKIQKSKELLLSGKTITETAMMLGFNTSDYFSTVFRKFNGVSPSNWLLHTQHNKEK